VSECDAITRTERSSTPTGATAFVLFLAQDATPLFIKNHARCRELSFSNKHVDQKAERNDRRDQLLEIIQPYSTGHGWKWQSRRTVLLVPARISAFPVRIAFSEE